MLDPIEQPRQPGASAAPPDASSPAFRGRRLAIAAAIVFFISAVFPIVAGFVKDTASWPKWWGRLDVSIAFVLAALTFAVLAGGHGKVSNCAEKASYRAYRILHWGIFALLAVFFLVGDRIVWSNCLTGFGWRFWLLLYALPSWFALWECAPTFNERFASRTDVRGGPA